MKERELILKSLEGDHEAFGMLVEIHRAKIFRHCLELVHEESSAEDLTQDAFLHAYQHLQDFQHRSSFYTWVYRIAHNLSLNFLKREKKRQEVEKKECKPVSFNPEGLREYLAFLPQKQRVVFELYYFDQLSQKEIGKKLKLAHGTVRSRLHYARKRLRKLAQ